MDDKLVGVVNLGHDQVRIYIRDGYGAEFAVAPALNETAIIKIGSEEDYETAFEALMHELVEMAFLKMNLRYQQSSYYGTDYGRFLFSLNHVEFTEAIHRASVALLYIHKKFKKEYKKCKKNSKK